MLRSLMFLLMLIPAMLCSQWSDTAANSQDLGDGISPRIVATSENGAYVAWLSDGDFHIYLQYLDPQGVPQWRDPLLVSNAQNSSWIAINHLNLLCDTAGNAILSAVDTRSGNWEVYAYKVNQGGDPLWSPTGIQLSSTGGTNISPRMVLNPNDNSILVTWTDNYSQIRMQRVDASGTVLWDDGGLIIAQNGANLMSPLPLYRDTDEYVVQWVQQTGSFPAVSSVVQVQAFDADGNALFAAVDMGTVVGFPMGNWLQDLKLNAAGDSYSSWTELTGQNQTGKVNHLTETGQLNWLSPVELSNASTHFRISPRIALPAAGNGCYAVWGESDADQFNRGVSAQYVSSGGVNQWGSTGLAVIPLDGGVYTNIEVESVANDLVVVLVADNGTGAEDIQAGRLDVAGTSVWTPGMVQLTTSGADKSDLQVAKNTDGVFLVWSEAGSIRVHSLKGDGSLGAPSGEVDPTLLQVPDAYSTIQAAIEASTAGDTILIASGTYSETVQLPSHALTMGSMILLDGDTAHVAATILNGLGNHPLLVLENGSDLTLRGMTLRNGVGMMNDPDGDGDSSDYGGAIYCQDSDLEATQCVFTGNSVTQGGGGALFFSNSLASLDYCRFQENTSTDVGGAIYARAGSELRLDGVEFLANHCSDVGGGLYARDGSLVRIQRSVFMDNTSDHAGASIGLKNNAELVLIHSTLVNNAATHFGGALYSNASLSVLVNTILWNNTATPIHFADFDPASDIWVTHSLMDGADSSITTNDNGSIHWLEGNTDWAPLFDVNSHLGLGLSMNSAALNGGTELFILNADTLFQLTPDQFMGHGPDMGAFERMMEGVTYFDASEPWSSRYSTGVDSFSVLFSEPIELAGEWWTLALNWFQDMVERPLRVDGNTLYTYGDDLEVPLYVFDAALGSSWETVQGIRVQLTDVAIPVETPFAAFDSCLAFTVTDSSGQQMVDYLAPEFGLVRRDIIVDETIVSYDLTFRGVWVSTAPETQLPETMTVSAYPNPFNNTLQLSIELPEAGDVKVRWFDIRGVEVNAQQLAHLPAGRSTIGFQGIARSGDLLGSGVYMLVIESKNQVASQKVLLVK